MQTSVANGFYANPLIKIPFPPKSAKVAEKPREFGFDKQVEQFVETINHGAEQAATRVTPIFLDAIKGMPFRDVYGIWKGDEDTATQDLRVNTLDELKSESWPEIAIKPTPVKSISRIVPSKILRSVRIALLDMRSESDALHLLFDHLDLIVKQSPCIKFLHF